MQLLHSEIQVTEVSWVVHETTRIQLHAHSIGAGEGTIIDPLASILLAGVGYDHLQVSGETTNPTRCGGSTGILQGTELGRPTMKSCPS